MKESLVANLADWAYRLEPGPEDEALARRSLVDTFACAGASAGHPSVRFADALGGPGRLSALSHLVDFDDLHIPSTTHISAVCVPAAISTDGGARAFLAGAGVMARLGIMLGWGHYGAGWHATCTAGAPAAAVAAGIGLALDAEGLATALLLAIPAAGGVQSGFGSAAKSLQVGFAVDAGVRAARLAEAGADADEAMLDQWLGLVGSGSESSPSNEVVPGGLAIKLFPCCYALQRPIVATRTAMSELAGASPEIESVRVDLREDVLTPLIDELPENGLQGKFSLEYAIAASVVDEYPGIASFTDDAVNRDEIAVLYPRIQVVTSPGGGGLLAGEVAVRIKSGEGAVAAASVDIPPGAPPRSVSDAEMTRKVVDCVGEFAPLLNSMDWSNAKQVLARMTGGGQS